MRRQRVSVTTIRGATIPAKRKHSTQQEPRAQLGANLYHPSEIQQETVSQPLKRRMTTEPSATQALLRRRSRPTAITSLKSVALSPTPSTSALSLGATPDHLDNHDPDDADSWPEDDCGSDPLHEPFNFFDALQPSTGPTRVSAPVYLSLNPPVAAPRHAKSRQSKAHAWCTDLLPRLIQPYLDRAAYTAHGVRTSIRTQPPACTCGGRDPGFSQLHAIDENSEY